MVGRVPFKVRDFLGKSQGGDGENVAGVLTLDNVFVTR